MTTTTTDHRLRELERKAAVDHGAAEQLKVMRVKLGLDEHYQVVDPDKPMKMQPWPNHRLRRACRVYRAFASSGLLRRLKGYYRHLVDKSTGTTAGDDVWLTSWARIDLAESNEDGSPRWVVEFTGYFEGISMYECRDGRYKPGNIDAICQRLDREHTRVLKIVSQQKERKARIKQERDGYQVVRDKLTDAQERIAGFLAFQGFDVKQRDPVSSKHELQRFPRAREATITITKAVQQGKHTLFPSKHREGLVKLVAKSYLTPEGLARVLKVLAEEEARAEAEHPTEEKTPEEPTS